MAELDGVRRWLDERLAGLVEEHDVPGAVVGVLAGDEVVDAAAGVLSQRTGVEATTDSVFQIGSITKLWTTALVMQLVDEGKVELDAPVRTYLPGFRVADEAASAAVTVRQLLSHTAGFEGDVFVETTRGDDAVERLVTDVFPGVRQVFEPGERFSYNNAAFVTLGRIVEVLRGQPFAAALRQWLAEPLGLTSVAANADEAILHRAAVGHLRPDPDQPQHPASVWALHHSEAPAGAMLAMTARDLLGFAGMHLRGGLAPDGTRLLSAASVAAVREPQVDMPRFGFGTSGYGLGWARYDWPGGQVVGHNGGTVGQYAFLRLAPEHGVAVALLTNGGRCVDLYVDVMRHVFDELTGIEVPPLPIPPAEPEAVGDPARYVGRYQADVHRVDVQATADGLLMVDTPLGELAERLESQPERHRYVRLDGDRFITAEPRDGFHQVIVFVGDDGDGRAAFYHAGRAFPRVG